MSVCIYANTHVICLCTCMQIHVCIHVRTYVNAWCWQGPCRHDGARCVRMKVSVRIHTEHEYLHVHTYTFTHTHKPT